MACMRRMWWVAALGVLLVACLGGGPIGTVETDAGTFRVIDVESGQMDVTACAGIDCTIVRDGIYFSHREILVILEPVEAIADARAVTGSDFAESCSLGGGLYVHDDSSGFGCESFYVSAEDDGGVAIVFSNERCRDCPEDGFDGDLYLVVPGTDELLLN